MGGATGRDFLRRRPQMPFGGPLEGTSGDALSTRFATSIHSFYTRAWLTYTVACVRNPSLGTAFGWLTTLSLTHY
jgi:hypothetical protein